MATFQVSNKNKNKSNKNVKVIAGWILLALSSFIFLFSATNLVPFLRYFFLGLFGIFVYPLSFVGLVVALAFLNNKKYVMPKRYAIFLILSLYFFLCIIQLIILGGCKGLSYGEYVGLNYSKQITAGGLFIGFIPSSLMILMGSVATYIILSIAFACCVAFFIEALISLKKTKNAAEPIKLQIKQRERIIEEGDERNKIFRKERESREQAEKEQVNVMLAGNIAQQEKKEKSARELLGLVGSNQNISIENYSSHQMSLPEDEDETIPNNMTMKEYLLSPPKVDLEKFKSQQMRKKLYSTANSIGNVSAESVNLNHQEINQNVSQLKNQQQIQPDVDMTGELDGQGSLPVIKPEEITNEAEDIIRAVVEQEKIERGETNIEDIDAISIEDEHLDYNEFIDFDDVEDDKRIEDKKTQDFSRDRQDFSRDRQSLTNNIPQRSTDLSRDGISSRERGFEDRSNNLVRHNDEMERRRGFVNVEPEKKEEFFKPYNYSKPSIDLLTTMSEDPATFNADMAQKRVSLENALETFGIPAKVSGVVIGPTVTRYEIEMPEGISVKKILSLDADIAYALSANGQIRIEAPIPGRRVVGIEVPNKKVAMVSIKDVLNAKEFTLSPSPLTFALGKDITGNVKVCNLQKMPHLLVAGTTGSGKSVCLNTIITSLLYKSSPDEVKFIMIDPKQVELSMYEGLPHMIIPRVITDPTKAVNALTWAVDEMERRFKLISEARVRDIQEYNKTERVLQNKAKKLPFIVIIFDEFADFMAVAKNEIEERIRRLAGKARAAGVHLILATQRPSTDVVTGTLKANLPARIAFRVAGRVDSEVILGATGAEKLLGNGDMLYKPADTQPQRIQGCYITTEETKSVVNYIVDNNEETYDAEAIAAINNPNKSNGSNGKEGNNGVDPLLPQALKICIDNGVASTTMVQRKLAIGYPKAARIIDQMEERGYISTADGSKQRTVYITIEEFYAIFGDIYD